jgi:hypothetical protein
MTDLRKAAEMALKRLDMCFVEHGNDDDFEATQALRQALAEPEHEWVGLTDEEIYAPWPLATRIEFARWVEAKLKEKNAND